MPDRPPADPELVRRYGRSPDTVPESADPADGFLRLACLTYGATRCSAAPAPGTSAIQGPRGCWKRW